MKVEDDGHLCLHLSDLTKRVEHALTIKDFRYDAQVAAAYANSAGQRVTFVEPGKKVVRIMGNKFFKEKKVK